jgi:hypothetical protein
MWMGVTDTEDQAQMTTVAAAVGAVVAAVAVAVVRVID